MTMNMVNLLAGLRVVAALGVVVAGLGAQASGPGARYGQSMAYDRARAITVLFGGARNSTGQAGTAWGDTWEWNGSLWTQAAPTVTPSPRYHASMAYDEHRSVIVMFGGAFPGVGELNETWEWNGTTWVQRVFTTNPAPRAYHTLTYDRDRGELVLFGGHSNVAGNPIDYGDTWVLRSTGWQSAATQGPSPRRYHAAEWHQASGTVVLFGGFQGSSAPFGDTWLWNGATWLQANPTTAPSARASHAMSLHPNDSRLMLIGGGSLPGSNDGWAWDGSSWSQMLASDAPPVRTWATNQMVLHEATQRTILVGGYDGTVIDDAWKFDGTRWSRLINYQRSHVNGHLYGLTPPMTWPQAEALAILEGGHLATVRDANENSWLYGTMLGSGAVPNAWIGLTDSQVEGNWVWASGEPRQFVNNFCPGEPNNGTAANYAHFWNGNACWNDTFNASILPGIIELPPGPSSQYTATSLLASASPVATSSHSFAPTPNGAALLFGGNTSGLPQPFTYTLAGASWSKEFSILNPMARTDASLLLDPARNNNVLFGGRNAIGTALGDTWTWAAGQWTYLTPATAPAPRSGHRMAFDRVANLGLLFGGENATGTALSDFWSWNGTTWAQLTPSTLPPARALHGMAFDSLRNRTIVHGGKFGTTRLDDVWEWDGVTWTDVTPQGAPSWGPAARDGHAMAYDPRSERIVLHGGETSSGCQQDVWSWDGTEWTIHIAQTGSVPSARAGSQLIHDSGSNRLLLFAGGCGTAYTNDLWQLILPTFARSSSYGTPCIGSRGPLTLSVISDSLAVIGQTFQMEMSNVPIFSPCVGLLGLSNTELNGIPLPFDLAFLSMPGCSAYMSNDISFPLPPPNNLLNTTAWDLAIPLDPVFLGLHIYLQGLALEFGGGRFATVTNGVDARIGDR